LELWNWALCWSQSWHFQTQLHSKTQEVGRELWELSNPLPQIWCFQAWPPAVICRDCVLFLTTEGQVTDGHTLHRLSSPLFKFLSRSASDPPLFPWLSFMAIPHLVIVAGCS
jgi:hypothetical protein